MYGIKKISNKFPLFTKVDLYNAIIDSHFQSVYNKIMKAPSHGNDVQLKTDILQVGT